MKKVLTLFLTQCLFVALFAQTRAELAAKYAPSSEVVKSFGEFENCWEAEPIYDGNTIQFDFVEGPGDLEPLSQVSCLAQNEHQVHWYKFSFEDIGTFEFLCTPMGLNADYDFALFKGNCPTSTCGNAPSELVACSFIGNVTNPPFVPTGISSDPGSSFGVPNNLEIENAVLVVEPNINYYLVLDNITSNNLGFQLEFGGTATFKNTNTPATVIPGTTCDNAPLIECPCLENGISLTTGGPNVIDLPPSFCGSIENEQWISFEACWCAYDFIFENGNCTNDQGIEAQIFSTCGADYIPKTNCITVPPGAIGQFTNINCLIGEQLYLMVDGVMGDMCNYNIRIEEKPTPPVVILQDTIFGEINVCEGDSLVYYSPPVTGAAHCDYVYTGNGEIENPSHDSVVVVFGPNDGLLCFIARNCEYLEQTCIAINVFNKDTVITDSLILCENDLPYQFNNLLINTGGLFNYDTLNNTNGCDSILQVYVKIHNEIFGGINATGDINSPAGVLLQNPFYDPSDPYVYLWSGPDIETVDENNIEQTVFIAGQYQLLITDTITDCSESFTINLNSCPLFNYPVAPADSCENAPPFCADYLNGYCSSNDNHTADVSGNLTAIFGCPIENNQWLTFTPCETTVEFILSVNDCGNNEGLQFGVFQTDNCLDYNVMATCFSISNNLTDTFVINNLIIGDEYHLMIDGINGDVCHWEISNLLGGSSGNAYLQEDVTPGYIEGECSVCLGVGGPPSDIFPYSIVPPICDYIPIDTLCNGDPIVCPVALQQICEPHLDTLIKATEFDTVWHITPPYGGHFVNDDSIGSDVEIIWDTTGTFFIDVELVGVEFDTIIFWNDCINECGGVCPDPEGDQCLIERKTVTVTQPDDDYVVIEEICPGECAFYDGDIYCPGIHQIPIDINGCPATLILEVIPSFESPIELVVTGESEINCNNPTADISAMAVFGPADFSWSTGDTGPNITVTSGGAYTVTAYSIPYGCFMEEETFFVEENINEEEIDLGEIILCEGECYDFMGEDFCDAGNYEEIMVDSMTGCTITYLFSIIIQANTPLQIGVVSEICDGIGETYTVGFDITNGVSPFAVNGNPLTGNFYQSDPIDSGDPYLFEIMDNNNCINSSEIVQGVYVCPCISDAGTMGTSLLNQCEDDVTVPDYNNDAVLDTNDILVFILHDSSGNNLGKILGINSTGAFGFVPGDMEYGVTYFISPVVGNENSGTVNLSANCVSVGVGQPVVFYENPVLTIFPVGELNCNNISSIIETAVSGGTGQVNYEWTGPNGFQSDVFNPSVNEGGTYTCVITDEISNCTFSETINIEDDFEVPALDLETNGEINCNVPTATLSAASDLDSVVFEWTFPSGDVMVGENIMTNISGEYNVLVTAENGCAFSDVIVQEEDLSTPFLQAGDALIDCNNSVATLSGFSGEPGVTFQWILLNGDTSNGVTITTVFPGDYSVVATGLNGCTSVELVEVEIDTLSPDLTAQGGELTCAVPNILLEANTNTPGAEISWIFPTGNEVNGSSTITNIEGNYTVTSTAQNGCTTSMQVSVINNEEVPVFSLTEGEIDCVQLEDTLYANTTQGNLEYTWVSPNGDSLIGDFIITEYSGVYSVTASLPNGCTTVLETNIIDNSDPPIVDVNYGEINCIETSTILSANSNSNGIEYNWIFPNGNEVTGNDLISTVAGDYTLIATATNGCTSEELFEIIENIEPPILSVLNDSISCSHPIATLVASADHPNVIFNWILPDGSNYDGVLLESNLIGEYTISAVGLNGCVAQEIIVVEEVPGPDLNFSLQVQPPECAGDTNGFIIIGDVIGASDPYDLTINDELIISNEIMELAEGNYQITVIDDNGCTGDTLIEITDPVGVDVNLGDDLFVGLNEFVQLDFQSSINPISTIEWSGPNGQTWNNVESITVLATANGVYTLTITDANGCSSTNDVALYVAGQGQVFVPNAFSPNGDFNNDRLTVFSGPDVKEIISFVVFDRWGEQVFSNENFQPNDLTKGWDGTFKNKLMDMSIFVYKAEVEFKTGEKKMLTGDVMLMR